MGKFNIDTITAHVRKNTLLEPNRYEVIITGPVQISKDVLFNCNRCNVPGHSMGSFEHSVIGPKRKIPNEEIYDDISTTFYNTHHLNELKTIDKWIKKIGGDSSFRLAYYNDIVGEMSINIYNLREEKMATVKVFEVYPTGVSEIELAYNGDGPSEITVNWSYHSYEIM